MTTQQLQRLLEASIRVNNLVERQRELEQLQKTGDWRFNQIFPDASRVHMSSMFSESEAPIIRHALKEILRRLSADITQATIELDVMLKQITVPDNFGLPF